MWFLLQFINISHFTAILVPSHLLPLIYSLSNIFLSEFNFSFSMFSWRDCQYWCCMYCSSASVFGLNLKSMHMCHHGVFLVHLTSLCLLQKLYQCYETLILKMLGVLIVVVTLFDCKLLRLCCLCIYHCLLWHVNSKKCCKVLKLMLGTGQWCS